MAIRYPLGIEDFKVMRTGNSYYVDKTMLIKELLRTNFTVELITRPRRFGKTLTMSMLKYFFDIKENSKDLFEYLAIGKEISLCEEYENQWPTIFISLKSVEGMHFQEAYESLETLVGDLFKEFHFLRESDRVNSEDIKLFKALEAQADEKKNLKKALLILCRMLNAHYGKPVILLIDEYDVPLAKASENGYYSEMIDLMRAFLGNVLKTNPYLKFAVLTGCLRISKESIFTGMNNLIVDDVRTGDFTQYIGFTSREVETMVEASGQSEHMEEIKTWYDGYLFGTHEMYCPWSVLNHLNKLQNNPNCKPQNYWANTSHNGVIYNFINQQRISVRGDLEALLEGRSITTAVEENLTYDYLTSSEKNFWSLLYATGYLTATKPNQEPDAMELRIPNEEVRSTFAKSILEWLDDYFETLDRSDIFDAFWKRDTKRIKTLVSNLLFSTISYYDYKEDYYHAFIAGMFTGLYYVKTNDEIGNGRPDILVMDDINRRVLVIEIKYAKEEAMIDAKMKEGINQFKEERYLEGIEKGYHTKIGYVMVFNKKDCFVEEVQSSN